MGVCGNNISNLGIYYPFNNPPNIYAQTIIRINVLIIRKVSEIPNIASFVSTDKLLLSQVYFKSSKNNLKRLSFR